MNLQTLHKSGIKIPTELVYASGAEIKEWENIFDTINDAITIHDKDFNIVQANRAAQEMLGLSMQKILGQKCYLSYHGKGCPPDKCPSCMTMRTGVVSTTEIYEPHLDKHLEIKAFPRYDENKNPAGVVHVVRDITIRKKAEERQKELQAQIVQMQKMETIGRLAGGIAHDFNNILTVIIGYSELILHDLPEESQFRPDLKTIMKSGKKGAILTGQLLAFSRKQILQMELLDLNVAIKDMENMLMRLIGENIDLELHLNQGLAAIKADPGQLEQIILNLAVNSGDAMPDGGKLIIETAEAELDKNFVEQHPGSKPGRHVVLVISDTGTGMTDKIKQKIFEPFFTTKARDKGTGLGLATVYGIVKQHGGQIYVNSESGWGTAFSIYFPVSEEAATVEHAWTDMKIPPGEKTILVAEDDDAIRAMIKKYLEPLGYNLLLAENGEVAANISQSYEDEIHILLTDVIMPKMDGQKLADVIRKDRPGIKTIFMSGYTDDAIAHHGVLAKGVNFIAKPITLSKLAGMLRDG